MGVRPAEVHAINRRGQEVRRLLVEGVAGQAVIVAAHDTGERLAGNVVLELELEVTLPEVAPYRTTLRTPIAGDDVGPYRPGRRYGVRVDPVDRTNLAFG
jgi:hypothetical protein